MQNKQTQTKNTNPTQQKQQQQQQQKSSNNKPEPQARIQARPPKVGSPAMPALRGQKQLYPARTESTIRKVPPRTTSKPKLTHARQNKMSAGPNLPSTGMHKGLSFHNTSDQIHNRLKKKSPWYCSIIHPLTGADVKIPDATGVETGTIQCIQRTVTTTNATGIAGAMTDCLHPNFDNAGYRLVSGGATTLAVAWNPPVDWDSSDTLKTFASGVRIVSAAAYIQSLASLTDCSGEITAFVIPSTNFDLSTVPLTYIQNLYKSALIPINNNRPAEVRWYPIKTEAGQYDIFYAPNLPTGESAEDSVPLWQMGFVVSGSPVGTQFQVTFVINYEFIPNSNTLSILDAKPSPTDAQEEDLVLNWTQDMSPANITTTKTVSTAPATSTVEDPGSETGFGMFFEVIKELAPIALSLL